MTSVPNPLKHLLGSDDLELLYEEILTPSQRWAYDALLKRSFFKLICGGSFTDAQKVAQMVAMYAHTGGVACVDIAPEITLIETIHQVYDKLPLHLQRPMVMVSVPLDEDPHFRKIELLNDHCVSCGLCIPICPTDAIQEGDAYQGKTNEITQPIETGLKLLIDQPLCYGCGRCVDVCPTQALALNPIYGDGSFLEALAHPLVEAVEIHTRYADVYQLEKFKTYVGNALQNKWVSVCFRPDEIPSQHWLPFLALIQTLTHLPVVIQVDGQPMSGSDDPESSLASLNAAKHFLKVAGDQYPWVTLSGGINGFTPHYLRQSQYSFIQGVGVGTMARKAVWPYLSESFDIFAIESPQFIKGVGAAQSMVGGFQLNC
ncbi:MAG: 4Fe-4S binding protein [Cyanobacteria bacterium]|nr:4Fe-4S binding protein [Cyanobacteriota bacterium]